MPELTSLSNDETIIEVRSFGIVTIEDMDRSLNRVIEIWAQSGCYRVLIDTREQEVTPHLKDHFRYIDDLPAYLSFAVLTDSWCTTRDKQHTLEAMALTKRKSYKLFYEKEKALDWLAKKTSK